MNQEAGPTRDERGEELLFVDLDGSLVATDLLWEQLFALLKKRPWLGPLVPLWVLKGRAGLKAEVASRAEAEPELLPYNAALLELLRERRREGARLVLATASPRPWAEAVARHLGLFDAVLATDAGKNLKGPGKLSAIREYCRGCGAERFGYVGDSGADLVIWKESASAYLVAPSDGLARRLGAMGPSVVVRTIGDRRRPMRAALRALRPRRWATNALIFVPLLAGPRSWDPPVLLAATLAAIAFSLGDSAIAVIDDLIDLPADRAHAEKRRRPFASGELPLFWGPPLSLASLAAAFGLAALALPAAFLPLLALFVALSSISTIIIIKSCIAGVPLRAGLYAIRIFAGGAAAGIPIPGWLIGVSIVLSLSLASVSRRGRPSVARGADGPGTPDKSP